MPPRTGTDLNKRTRCAIDQGGRRSPRASTISRAWPASTPAGSSTLFGKYQRALEAARDDAEAQAELRNAVLITVVADVARNYLEIRGLQMRLEIAKNDVATAQKTVDLLMTRFERGLSNELSTSRWRSASSRPSRPCCHKISAAQISAAEEPARGAARHLTSADLRRRTSKPPAKMPVLPERLRSGGSGRAAAAPAGHPPDRARTRGSYRPHRGGDGESVPLGGSHRGLRRPGRVEDGHCHADQTGPIWSFGPGAYWPLLDFGRLDALINIEEMKAHEVLVRYKKTIVAAVEEVDQAIKQYRMDLQRQRELGVALEASHRAVNLATERYERGVTDFLNVLDAQRQDYALAEQTAIAAEVVVLDYVAFYKALGGGWELYIDLPPIPPAQPLRSWPLCAA